MVAYQQFKVVNVKVEGLAEMADALREMPKATSANVLRRTLQKAAEPILNDAKALAPRGRTGVLQDISISSVAAQPSKMTRRGRAAYDKQSMVEWLVEAGPERQAVPQEFGTVHHPPHPYMRPAWAANKNRALDTIKKELWVEIEKAAARIARKTAKLARTAGG